MEKAAKAEPKNRSGLVIFDFFFIFFINPMTFPETGAFPHSNGLMGWSFQNYCAWIGESGYLLCKD